jgi:hypothetical protein
LTRVGQRLGESGSGVSLNFLSTPPQNKAILHFIGIIANVQYGYEVLYSSASRLLWNQTAELETGFQNNKHRISAHIVKDWYSSTLIRRICPNV